MKAVKKPSLAATAAVLLSAFSGVVLPSCALKGFNADESAASAQALEDALAILDEAIEETESASEISSIPLDVPVTAEEMKSNPYETDQEIVVEPVVFLDQENGTEVSSSDTLFQIEGGAADGGETVAAASESTVNQLDATPQIEVVEETVEAPLQPRQKVVVHRPAPKYGQDTPTTEAIDEFRTVRTTAYCHTEKDHVKYGELSAMGKPLRFGMVRSAAADWSRYPVGTRFRIVGKPYEYVIDDYGSALVGTETIDLYKPSGERMDDWGAREVKIEVIAWGSFDKSLEILEPRREKGEHIAEMIDAINNQEPGDKLASSVQPD